MACLCKSKATFYSETDVKRFSKLRNYTFIFFLFLLFLLSNLIFACVPWVLHLYLDFNLRITNVIMMSASHGEKKYSKGRFIKHSFKARPPSVTAGLLLCDCLRWQRATAVTGVLGRHNLGHACLCQKPYVSA